MTQQITSRENPKIKQVCKLLTSGRFRKETGLFVLEGLRLCMDALESGAGLEMVFFTGRARAAHAEAIDLLCARAAQVYEVGEQVFAKLSDTVSPQGVLCVCARETEQRQPVWPGRYVALERCADPANLGAIARSAAAFSLSGLILSDQCCDPYSPKALRASMGALLRLPVFVWDPFLERLRLCGQNAALYAAVLSADALPLDQVAFEPSAVVLIGNEANGLSEQAVGLCAHAVRIPMSGRAESLNAAVAASILMYQMQLQASTGS